MSLNVCEAHEKAAAKRGIDAAEHCWHRESDERDVCCWCGDLVVAETDDRRHHGQYRPNGEPKPRTLRPGQPLVNRHGKPVRSTGSPLMEAIKARRAETGCSLKEAVDFMNTSKPTRGSR